MKADVNIPTDQSSFATTESIWDQKNLLLVYIFIWTIL